MEGTSNEPNMCEWTISKSFFGFQDMLEANRSPCFLLSGKISHNFFGLLVRGKPVTISFFGSTLKLLKLTWPSLTCQNQFMSLIVVFKHIIYQLWKCIKETIYLKTSLPLLWESLFHHECCTNYAYSFSNSWPPLSRFWCRPGTLQCIFTAFWPPFSVLHWFFLCH